jgi:hypothetical protein
MRAAAVLARPPAGPQPLSRFNHGRFALERAVTIVSGTRGFCVKVSEPDKEQAGKSPCRPRNRQLPDRHRHPFPVELDHAAADASFAVR